MSVDNSGALTTELCTLTKANNTKCLAESELDNALTTANIPRINVNGSIDLGCATVPKKRASISYGFASSSNYVQSKAFSPFELDTLADEDIAEGEDEITSDVTFFTSPGRNVSPENCMRPTGIQADKFLQNLPLRHFERLKKFVETNEPKDGEHFVWIRDNTTSQVTMMSLQTMLNHIRNTPTVKRVKWRHLSLDRITVYRYSVPSIASTKQRMGLVFCVRNHQRCLLLALWLIIVVLLTASIILGSLYSSNAETNNTQTAFNFSQYFTRY